MNIGETGIFAGGVLTLLMAFFHTQFYKIFSWEEEFNRITERNRRIIYTIHLALLLLFIAFGGISLLYYRELAGLEGPSRGILMALTAFWLWRAVWQAAFFKPSKNRRLKRMRLLHYVLIVYFILLGLSYCVPLVFSEL
ncbi:hypothetical protein JW948_13870 [bacterium]|nr:hypothetical protein [bacterium]